MNGANKNAKKATENFVWSGEQPRYLL